MLNRDDRHYFWAALVISILLFSLFKHFYPYPQMIFDSYIYVKAAVLDWGANWWPIGYSRFLELFSLFSHSPALLVWLQYLIMVSACLFFFFTIRFLCYKYPLGSSTNVDHLSPSAIYDPCSILTNSFRLFYPL
jgi:hypothetical protein